MNAHQLGADGVILNTIVVDSLDVFPDLVDASIGGAIGDSIVDGEVVPKAPSLPTEAEYTAAVQEVLDAKAQERRYDNILSACTYATSIEAKFQAEGQACVAWRDAVWAYCYQALADVQAAERAAPTIAELIAELPSLEWPV